MKNSPSGTSRLAGAIAWVASPRSIASAAMTRSRNGAGASSMRPLRQRRRAERAGGDADGEEEIDRDLDVDPAADARLDDDRHERQRDAPTVQNQLVASAADPLAVVGAQLSR